MKNNKINDIAEKAGVSVSTVSRVFNNRPYVKENIRRRVLDIAVAMDYTPKAIARKDTISIVVSGPRALMVNNYEYFLINQFFAEASKLGMNLEFVSLDHIDRVYQNFSKIVIGMIYSEAGADILRTIKNIPVMTLNYKTAGCHYACTDHEGGIYAATKYLLDHGHRRIGILFAPYEENMSWGESARRDGYMRALAEYNVPFRRELLVYGARMADSPAKMILSENPTALIACGESLIMPLKYALDLFQKKVPDDVSLITFYSPDLTPYLLPEQTCICQDFDKLAQVAMQKVVDLINGITDKVEVLLPNRFIEGRSVRENNTK